MAPSVSQASTLGQGQAKPHPWKGSGDTLGLCDPRTQAHSFLSEAPAPDADEWDPTLSQEMREPGGLRSITGVRVGVHQVQGAKLGGDHPRGAAWTAASPILAVGTAGGKGRGAPC